MSDDLDRMFVDESVLTELMQSHMAWITKCLSDGDHKSWTPSLAALVKAHPDDKGELFLHVLAVPFDEHEEKHDAMMQIGRSIYQAKKIPVAAVLASEAWMSKQRPGQVAEYCEPRHDPMRQEGIIIFGLTIDGKHALITHAPFERDAKENIKAEAFGEIMKGAKLALLASFYRGFFEVPMAKAGIKP